VVLDHQKAAFDKLLAVGRACFAINKHDLPIRPRSNTLIVGPSGSGKSMLARAVSEEIIGEPKAFLGIGVADWILLGCTQRGAVPTWPMICRFLIKHANSEGVVIFLDEIDKIAGATSWESFLRTEIFLLLDNHIPFGIRSNDSDDDDDKTGEPQINEKSLAIAQQTLATKTLILGAGAFQHLWDNRAKPSLGFGGQNAPQEPTNLNHLAATLPRELTNRFRAELVVLPQLVESDYRRMLQQVAESIPDALRHTFCKMGEQRIPEAVACCQGCRFVEELLLDVVIAEREGKLTNPEPCTPHPEFKPSHF